MNIVDLSRSIYQGMQVFPGHQKTVIWKDNSHTGTRNMLESKTSYETMGMILSDHAGTHVDAFNHFDADDEALTIDQIKLENFITRGVCIDVSNLNSDQYIDSQVLEQALRSAKLELKKGDTVLLFTNYEEKGNKSEYPGLSRSGVDYISERGVLNIGTDAPSIDRYSTADFPAHNACIDKHIMNTENLTNLEYVVNKVFIFIGLPLKIRGGSGSPIRAIAILDLNKLEIYKYLL